MKDSSLMVVALGGNAISKPDEVGNVAQQFANSAATAKQIVDLVELGHRVAVTHGNGPQIGNFLLRNELGVGVIYPLAMEVAVAHVQGGMGFMIAQCLTNELNRRGDERVASAFITTVLVDRNDPAFDHPTKPVGRVMTRGDAEQYARDEGWKVKEVAPGQFRRVVPSPIPLRIMEIDSIRRAVEAGELLVACGGGGVPVIKDSEQGLRGVAAVIDKDLASSLFGNEIGADTIMFLTGVENVAVDFNQKTQRFIDTMTVSQAEAWLTEGQFPPGSMGPKVQGAINFLKGSNAPNARALIGHLDRAADVMAGRSGTCITRD
jgi:carbamate kinase